MRVKPFSSLRGGESMMQWYADYIDELDTIQIKL